MMLSLTSSLSFSSSFTSFGRVGSSHGSSVLLSLLSEWTGAEMSHVILLVMVGVSVCSFRCLVSLGGVLLGDISRGGCRGSLFLA